MEDKYLMRAEGVLGDEHSFVRLVDTMPQVRFCEHMPDEPEGRDEVELWDEIQHCHKAGTVLTNSQWAGGSGFWCPEHRPTNQSMAESTGNPDAKIDYRENMTAPGDQRIVDAARVSIAGDEVRPTSDDRKLVNYLVKNRHTTPMEQVRFTFHCRIPIFVARQWIRHRTGSFNEESARYGKLAADFYIPTMKRMLRGGQAKKNKQGSGAKMEEEDALAAIQSIQGHSDRSYTQYEGLLGAGVARELARMVLPLNIYTQWFWTTDLHNLMHFLTLRLHEHAQWESRRYAQAIVPMAEAVAPYAMDAFQGHRERWARAMKT
jgi:thymidylate synthase (FAD)